MTDDAPRRHQTTDRDLREAVRLGIWRGAQDHAEGLFRVYVSPQGGNDEAFAKGIERLSQAFIKATAIAAETLSD